MTIQSLNVVGVAGEAGVLALVHVVSMEYNGVLDRPQCHQFMVCLRDAKEFQRKAEDVELLNVRFVMTMKE